MNKTERLQQFIDQLLAAADVDSGSEALELISKTLTTVEDAQTDIPNQPENWQTDGRMYPPQEDQARAVDGRSDLIRYRSLGHNTFIRDNGAIEIRDLSENVILSKPGKDGRGINDE